MSIVYCRSTDGADADDGSTWALADATLAASLVAAGAGGRSYVSDNHAESQASTITLASPGTAASPNEILCVDDSAEPPTALATTGTLTVSVTTSSILFSGFAYVYGLSFVAGSGSSATVLLSFGSDIGPFWWRLENCALRLASTGANGRIRCGTANTGQDDGLTEWVDTTVQFGAVTQGINAAAPLRWTGAASAIVGTPPTSLFLSAVGAGTWVEVEGVDLSALGSGKSLVNVSGAQPVDYLFRNVKLGASVAIVTGTNPGPGGPRVRLVNGDSADTNHRYFSHDYRGEVSSETTIVRTGGASDGATAFSRKMVSSANTKFFLPLEGPWFKFRNDALSSTTITVEVVTDNVTLTDAEAWVEVVYPGTSGFPLSVTVTDRAATVLATPANQASSSEAWTTTGLTTPVKQALSVTFTPAEAGTIYARVVLAKPSTTLYACPKILAGSAYQWMDGEGDVVNAPAAGGGGGNTYSRGRVVNA